MASAAEQLAANINFGAFSKATELKKRLWFTLAALIVYRVGTYIPIPGIDPAALADIFEQQRGGILGMFDVFSGGALGRMTIFALNIMPYISASIIIQLLTTVSPHLEQLKKEGEQGRKNRFCRQNARHHMPRSPPCAPDGQSELSLATSAKVAPPSIWARSSPISVTASSLLRVADDDAAPSYMSKMSKMCDART